VGWLRINTDVEARPESAECSAVAAVFNLNHPAHTVHWHFFSMSVSNIVVIVLMLIVFAAAIAIPFPKHNVGGSKS
jgi:hypothetical protein